MAGNENAAAGERSRDTAGRDRSYGGGGIGGKDHDKDKIAGVNLGYTSTRNSYPSYRGPTGTRNPAAKPEKSPTTGAGFNATDKPKRSIWERVFQPRRTPNVTPSYKATPANLAKAISRAMPGPGLVAGAVQDITGMRPGFDDYTGQVQGPGDYDPKNNVGSMGSSLKFEGLTVPRLWYSQGARRPRY